MDPVVFFEEELFMLIPALFSSIPSAIFGIGTYVLSAMALHTIATRRGLNNPWISWVPVINCWILGSLSDQYQYVVKGQTKSRRKILLILNILSMVLSITIIVMAAVMAAGAVFGRSEAEIMANVMGPVMAVAGMALPLAGIAIAILVIRLMALFDVYRSLDPNNAVLFLVLSIFFGVTEPFFLFFNRHKDTGMPPRKRPEPEYVPPQEPEYVSPREPESEPWNQEQKDYL